MVTNRKGNDMQGTCILSYGQLDAIHATAGQLDVQARRSRERVSGGLYVGSVTSVAVTRATDYPDDVVAVFRRQDAPDAVRQVSYFGTIRRAQRTATTA